MEYILSSFCPPCYIQPWDISWSYKIELTIQRCPSLIYNVQTHSAGYFINVRMVHFVHETDRRGFERVVVGEVHADPPHTTLVGSWNLKENVLLFIWGRRGAVGLGSNCKRDLSCGSIPIVGKVLYYIYFIILASKQNLSVEFRDSTRNVSIIVAVSEWYFLRFISLFLLRSK